LSYHAHYKEGGFMTAMEVASMKLHLAAFYTLMEGIEKGVKQVSETVDRSWNGKVWNGSDQEFGALLANIQILVIAAERLQAPEFIKDAHQTYTGGLKKYLEFVLHAKKGKREDADQRFRESSRLINKAISSIDSVWKQLESA
jgi:hypothetical protein